MADNDLAQGGALGGEFTAKQRRLKPLTHDTHKARTRWFSDRVAWPFREAAASALRVERNGQMAAAAQVTANWQQAGPTNIGGRMTSLALDPRDPDRLFAGAAGGGVWLTEDAGQTWKGLWHREETLNVGALAIDPNLWRGAQ